MIEHVKFPKISRFNRFVTITEKIDGTNAAVVIVPENEVNLLDPNLISMTEDQHGVMYGIFAQSRSTMLSSKKDNFGFAGWVLRNAHELVNLGHGHHFGEWWGLGVNRGYGLKEKRFSLFNTARWRPADDAPVDPGADGISLFSPHSVVPPPCCSVVPVLYRGYARELTVTLEILGEAFPSIGSVAAPGFMDPEGFVIFHEASGDLYKITLKNDEVPKGVTIA